ncbi:MAG TPA: hypothetical protein VLH56_08370 [Dissulfurispiraceae bacterium]|nr:hypothetical protein [Dissulfurispiraceae bacterium]
MIPRRYKKDILILAGALLMLWGYGQLFQASPEPDYLNMQVTALTVEGIKVSGTATGVSGDAVTISINDKPLTVLKKQIVQQNGVSLDEQEANRALRAVIATIFGGLVVWIAVFVL